MTVPRTEKAYEKHAWIILFAIGIYGLIFSLLLLLGVDPDPTREEGIIGITFSELKASNPRFFDLVTYYLRFSGVFLLGLNLLYTAISVTAYRRGEKWAWYALLVIPVLFIGVFAVDPLTVGGSSGPIVVISLIVALLGQLLPYRKFFPRK